MKLSRNETVPGQNKIFFSLKLRNLWLKHILTVPSSSRQRSSTVYKYYHMECGCHMVKRVNYNHIWRSFFSLEWNFTELRRRCVIQSLLILSWVEACYFLTCNLHVWFSPYLFLVELKHVIFLPVIYMCDSVLTYS
jgi:hypothetical protein